MFTVRVTDSSAIEAFDRLIAITDNPEPALLGIGEKMLEFTRARFVLSQDPYGNTWAPNSDTTLRSLLHKTKKNFTSKGALSKRGQTFLATKKPLIGATRDLSTQFSKRVIGNDLVTVSSLMIYAATQQFGARQGQFGVDKHNHPIPWGDIPARPFFPDPQRGLPAPLQKDVNGVLRIALQNAARGS